MPGGENTSSMHMDYLIHRPNLTAIFADGTHVEVMKDGEFLF